MHQLAQLCEQEGEAVTEWHGRHESAVAQFGPTAPNH